MIRSTVFTFCFFCFAVLSQAQSCFPNGFTFTSQAQIDAFALEFPNCTTIGGNLEVRGDDIVSLDGLSNIQTIEGGLFIRNNENLKTLNGLRNLQKLGIDGESNSLVISQNSSLLTLDGLQGLARLNGELVIRNNLELLDLEGLNALSYVSQNVLLSSNPNLSDLSGLNALIKIGNDFYIEENSELQNLKGLSKLKKIGGSFYLRFNPILTDISALNGGLRIENALILNENTRLSECNIEAFCKLFKSTPEKVLKCKNASGCESIEEVQKECELEIYDSLNSEKGITFLPNQSERVVYLDENEIFEGKFVVFNHLGKRVLGGRLESKLNLDFLPSGFYLLKLNFGKKTEIKRIIKE